MVGSQCQCTESCGELRELQKQIQNKGRESEKPPPKKRKKEREMDRPDREEEERKKKKRETDKPTEDRKSVV